MANKPECVFRWDKAPIRTYKASIPIEEAVSDLIRYHNEERARVVPKGLLQEWIDAEQESNRNNRIIRKGDALQVRVVGMAGQRNYFWGCYFEFDGKRARLGMYSQNSSLAEMLKEVSDKQKELGVPRTVGDYVLLTKEEQKKATKYVMLQIARFGSMNPPEKTPERGRGRTARFEME